jgi:outer membrane protein assembly factor BamE (lipoprotein component of BamABCDE complex)
MSNYPAHIWIILLSTSLVVMVGAAIFARRCLISPAVSQRKLDRLAVGMHQEEVLSILGVPRERKNGDAKEQFWLYGPRWKRHLLVLEFTPEGKLTQFLHGVPKLHRRTKPAGEQ